MRVGAIRSPLHGPLCLMVTKVLVAAYVCPLGHKCQLFSSHDLHEIALDTSWRAIEGRLTKLEGSRQRRK